MASHDQDTPTATTDLKPRDERRLARAGHMLLFLEYILSDDFRAALETDVDVFHDALLEARESGWIHYTRLAAAMGLSDASTVSRWFNASGNRKTPELYRRRAAIEGLRRVLQHDIGELREGRDPVGGRSMAEERDLFIEPVVR